jgi:hypothetical protein
MSEDLSPFQQHTNEPDEHPIKKGKAYSIASTQNSWIWDHIKKMEERKVFVLRQICGDEVYHSTDYSNSMLVWHLRRHHKQVYQTHQEAEADARLQAMKPFLINCPKFEKCLYHLDGCYVPLLL